MKCVPGVPVNPITPIRKFILEFTETAEHPEHNSGHDYARPRARKSTFLAPTTMGVIMVGSHRRVSGAALQVQDV